MKFNLLLQGQWYGVQNFGLNTPESVKSVVSSLKFLKRRKEENLKKYLLILFCVVGGLMAGSLVLHNQLGAMGVVSGIYIEDVVLTSALDSVGWPVDRISRISSANKRIYCFINFRGIFGLPMGGAVLVRWYYGSEQIKGDYFHTNSEPAILWLEPPKNETFRPGHYRIEIFINQTLIRTVEFEVE